MNTLLLDKIPGSVLHFTRSGLQSPVFQPMNIFK